MHWTKIVDDAFKLYLPRELAEDLRRRIRSWTATPQPGLEPSPSWSHEPPRELALDLRAVAATQSGGELRELFERDWPAWRRWWQRPDARPRPSLAQCRRRLARHLPELLPVWERLVREVGGGDELAARFLSQWDPPAIVRACSGVVLPGAEPALARNYDYDPELFDAVVLHTRFTDRRVIGMSDQLWGLLDGMNDSGLAASLTFGGRKVVGPGFGIPLVVRYLLETCDTVEEAAAALGRIPVHVAYNLTLVDSSGDHATVFVGPDRPARVTRGRATTNHQDRVEWPEEAARTRSVERLDTLHGLLDDGDPEAAVTAMLRPPLRATAYGAGFGTLYTAVYRPAAGTADYYWPGDCWRQSFADFSEGVHPVRLAGPARPALPFAVIAR